MIDYATVPSDTTPESLRAMLGAMTEARANCAAEVAHRVVVIDGLLRDVEMTQTVRRAVMHHLQRLMLAAQR